MLLLPFVAGWAMDAPLLPSGWPAPLPRPSKDEHPPTKSRPASLVPPRPHATGPGLGPQSRLGPRSPPRSPLGPRLGPPSVPASVPPRSPPPRRLVPRRHFFPPTPKQASITPAPPVPGPNEIAAPAMSL